MPTPSGNGLGHRRGLRRCEVLHRAGSSGRVTVGSTGAIPSKD